MELWPFKERVWIGLGTKWWARNRSLLHQLGRNLGVSYNIPKDTSRSQNREGATSMSLVYSNSCKIWQASQKTCYIATNRLPKQYNRLIHSFASWGLSKSHHKMAHRVMKRDRAYKLLLTVGILWNLYVVTKYLRHVGEKQPQKKYDKTADFPSVYLSLILYIEADLTGTAHDVTIGFHLLRNKIKDLEVCHKSEFLTHSAFHTCTFDMTYWCKRIDGPVIQIRKPGILYICL